MDLKISPGLLIAIAIGAVVGYFLFGYEGGAGGGGGAGALYKLARVQFSRRQKLRDEQNAEIDKKAEDENRKTDKSSGNNLADRISKRSRRRN